MAVPLRVMLTVYVYAILERLANRRAQGICGLQPGHATGPAGKPGISERQARKRLSRSPAGGHPAVGVIRGGTFRDVERAHVVGTCCNT